MTNVKSLLALYVKMGGSLTDTYSDIAGGIPVGQYSLISDAILACSKKYSSGGSAYELPTASAETKGGVKIGSGMTMTGEVLSVDGELPVSTASNNGQALVVSDGAPAWGDKLPMIAHYTVAQDEQTQETTITCDKTNAQILTATRGGTPVICLFSNGWQTANIFIDDDTGSIILTFVVWGGSSATYVTVTHAENGQISFISS